MKLTQSLIAIAALSTLSSTLSFAGGDINPVTVFEQEPVVVPVEPVPTPKAPPPPPPPAPKPPKKAEPLGLYVGGGIAALAARETNSAAANIFSAQNNQDRQVGLTAKLGYDFMDYLGAELRGSYGLAKVGSSYTNLKQFGAYLKPNYDVTEEINLYGLVGASSSNHAGLAASSTGLSYGAGLDYGVTDNTSIFTDIINFMDKPNVPESWGLTLGASYKF